MLIGQYTSKISKKRRLAIPSKFRISLGKTFIVTRWYESCLALVANDDWNLLVKRLTGDKKGLTSSLRDTDRFLLSLAFEAKPDSQGRVIIPENLARYAKLEDTAIFLGLGDRVEVWDASIWKDKEEKIVETASSLIENLKEND